MPKPRQMSASTCGVAVAVSARMRSARQSLREAGQLQVVGPEVVAPLGDAVGLVDGEQRHRARAGAPRRNRSLSKRSGATYSSRSRPARTSSMTRADLVRGRASSRAARPRCRAALRRSIWSFIRAISGETTRVSAGQQQGGQLVAERLAAAGGKDGRGRSAGQQVADHRFLTGTGSRGSRRSRERRRAR